MIAQTVGDPLHAFAGLQEKKSFAYGAGKKPNKAKRGRPYERGKVEFLIDSLCSGPRCSFDLRIENARGERMGRNDNPKSYR